MNPRKTAIATVITVAVAAAGLSPTGVARAADTSEVQELKREINQMRAEVQALQVVLVEATELERQRSVNLARAMKEPAAPPPASAPAGNSEPASAPPEPARAAAPSAPAPASASASASDKSRGATRHRRHRHSPRSRSKLR